jgi:hypothetical protein
MLVFYKLKTIIMKSGKLIFVDNEPRLQDNNKIFDICKGSLIALDNRLNKLNRIFYYILLSNQKVALLN